MNKSIYIYGASGHGMVVAEIAKACGYDDIIFIDDGENDYINFEKIKSNTYIPLVFGIGSNPVRANLFEKVEKHGFKIVTLVHPSSVISSSVNLGKGTVVMPNVVINAKATIGNGVILNTSSVIEHDCIIDDFVHISPSTSLAGNVKVGLFTHIGIGSCLIQGIKVGNNSLIGAGSVVINDINDDILAYGNPCKEIKSLDE